MIYIIYNTNMGFKNILKYVCRYAHPDIIQHFNKSQITKNQLKIEF